MFRAIRRRLAERRQRATRYSPPSASILQRRAIAHSSTSPRLPDAQRSATSIVSALSPSLWFQRYRRFIKSRNRWSIIYLCVCAGGFVALFAWLSGQARKRLWERSRRAIRQIDRCNTSRTGDDTIYDVCVVGAGPSGASCAYYLATMGHSVLLLDGTRFPRDAVCGDRVAPIAQEHLRRMGVLEELLQKRESRWAQSGGFVSPNGCSFRAQVDTVLGERLMAVQRIILDAKVCAAAVGAGARLLEGHEVTSAELRPSIGDVGGHWVVRVSLCDLEGENYSYRARMLVAADGPESMLARSLGVIPEPPRAYACRSFAKAGTHEFPNVDHVVFYPSLMRPGYMVVFHELEDFLNLTCYFFPSTDRRSIGPGDALQLRRIYEDVLRSDPDVTRALGPAVEITAPQFYPVRYGGVKKSYADHFIVIGAAAGLVDPLSGAGLHYAMDSAEMAAQVISKGLRTGDLSSTMLSQYQQKWKRAFGRDLWVAEMILGLLHRFPRLLDAAAVVIQQRGTTFVETWAAAMMGGRSKSWFLRPSNFVPIVAHALWLWIKRSVRSFGTAQTGPPSATAIE